MKRFFKHQHYSVLLLIGDALALLLVFKLAHYWHLNRTLETFDWPLLSVILISILFLYIFNAYTPDYANRGLRILTRTCMAVAGAGFIIFGLAYITRATYSDPFFWRGTLVTGYLMFLPYACVIRVVVSWFAFKAQASRKWLLIGDSAHIDVFKDAYAKSGLGSGLVSLNIDKDDVGRKVIEDALSKDRYEGIVIATGAHQLSDEIERELMYKRLAGMKVYAVLDFYEKYLWKIPIDILDESWIVLAQGFDLVHHKVQLNIKRSIDFLISLLILCLTLPLLLIVMCLIKIDSRGPAIFKQVRTGKNGEPFTLYKLRTMQEGAEVAGPQWAQVSDPRVTKIGRVLRKLRIDELPQLWNVIKGDMSFIGPRPERPDFVSELEKQLPYYDLRALVAPGISGWAQVMYPYGASVEDAKEKLQYDLYYIKNYSLALDLIITMKTLRVVFHASGR